MAIQWTLPSNRRELQRIFKLSWRAQCRPHECKGKYLVLKKLLVNVTYVKYYENKITDDCFAFVFQRCAVDDDTYSIVGNDSFDVINEPQQTKVPTPKVNVNDNNVTSTHKKDAVVAFNASRRLSCKWSTGAGPRIGCVRDYPEHLQSKALEQVHLSPRPSSSRLNKFGPIPSPRPSPKVRMSPRLVYMGLPSPRNPISTAS